MSFIGPVINTELSQPDLRTDGAIGATAGLGDNNSSDQQIQTSVVHISVTNWQILSYSGQVMRNIWISICVTVIAVFLITDFDQILQILKYCFVIFSISFCIIGTVVLTVLVNILTSPKVTLNRF